MSRSIDVTMKSMKVVEKSMQPLLQNGDVVYYKDILFNDIKENDILIVLIDGRYTHRRVLYKNSDYLIAKGDNIFHADSKITAQDIKGKVTHINRRGSIINPETLYLIQSSLYLNEITSINKIFFSDNINFILLKGLPLHLYYEGTPPRRLYADCDILLSQSDSQNANKIFFHAGYKKGQSLIQKKRKGITQNYGEEAFVKTIHGLNVVFDVHSEPVFLMTRLNVMNFFYPSSLIDKMNKVFFKNRRFISFNNQKIAILSPSHLIVYLALHFFHHNYKGSHRLGFINKIITKENTNHLWKEMEQFIKSYKLQTYVYIVFKLLKKYYSTPIPDKFLNKIVPKKLMTQLFIQQFSYKSVFEGEDSIKAGIYRFILLFIVSPLPIHRKLMVFSQIEIVREMLALLFKK